MNTVRLEKIRVRADEVEGVAEFVYLGAKVSKDGRGTEDIKNRLRKATGAFQNLTKLWNTRGIGKKTKVQLYKTLVRPILLYGYETWKMTNWEEKKLDASQFRCLRRILRIRWPAYVSNQRIIKMTHINRIGDEIRRWCWTWIGHKLHGERSSDCMVELRSRPEDRSAVGRPRKTWRRTVEEERWQEG